MRCAIWLMSGAMLAAAAVSGVSCICAGLGGKPPAEVPAADNSFCRVCHMNYENEKLALDHCLAGIGCAKCHGESDNHSSDENNITPPDVMYDRPAINPMCAKCHPSKEVARSRSHKPVLAQMASNEKVCTDCHGTHRLAVRTRRWDKRTGKLIADDGVRMTGQPAGPP